MRTKYDVLFMLRSVYSYPSGAYRVIFKICEAIGKLGYKPAILFVHDLNAAFLKYNHENIGIDTNYMGKKNNKIKDLIWKALGFRITFNLFMPVLRAIKGYPQNTFPRKVSTFFSLRVLKRVRFSKIVATNWQSAFIITDIKPKSKLYFFLQVEEDNPLFSGNFSQIANASYSLPLKKIVITDQMMSKINDPFTKRIHVGIDESIFRLTTDVKQRDLKIIIMLRTGQFKGSELGINAARLIRSKSPSIKIVGVGDLKKNDVPDFIEYLGFVTQDLLSSLFNSSLVFILPSYLEQWGLPILESMACGCAVVVNKGVAFEVATELNAFLTDPTPECISKSVFFLLENKQYRYKIVDEGIKTSIKYSYSNMVKEFITILNEK